MAELTNVASAKRVRQKIVAKLMQVDESIKSDDLYFSQTPRGYCIEYKPKYPEKSNGDFLVYQDLDGTISIHGNMDALVPTVETFKNIKDFEERFIESRGGKEECDVRTLTTTNQEQSLNAVLKQGNDKLEPLKKPCPLTLTGFCDEENEDCNCCIADKTEYEMGYTKEDVFMHSEY